MSDTIREHIIAAMAAKLTEVRTVYGYATECGQHVYRAAMDVPSSLIPAIVLFPRVEQTSREFGKQIAVMPVEVKGLTLLEGENASTLGEKLLGDLITCILGVEYTRTFTSGGTYQILPSHVVVGATSSAHGIILAVTLTTGLWADGTAAGTLRFRSQVGSFQAENLNVGANTNVVTIAGAATQIMAKDISGGLLVDDINYSGGGVEDYPATKDEALVVTATFNVTYQTNIGNPYSQT
jgi:hypothetical protein